MAMFDKYGADAMRWYLLSSPILRGNDVSVSEEGIRDTVRQVILPLWNSWYFLSLYANAESRTGSDRGDSDNVLDRYALAKLRTVLVSTTAAMDGYDLFGACAIVREFLDSLTNWYIRRSRDRFWAGEQAAIDTLHTVLSVLTRVTAPLLPLISEEIHAGLHGGLGGDAPSVHLADWPDTGGLPADDELVSAMDAVRDVCSAALSVRKNHGVRVRQPLATLIVARSDGPDLARFADLIADEVNVREVRFTDDVASVASVEIAPVPARLGPRFGQQTQQIIVAIKQGRWTREGEGIRVGDAVLAEGEFTERLVAAEGSAAAGLPGARGVVLLDTSLTDELRAEGTARDLVRSIQQARRDAGCAVSDRVRVVVSSPDEVREAVSSHEEMILQETLADSLEFDPAGPREVQIEGAMVGVRVERSGDH
jgi:isoleucyl-tRNA synthetase